MPRHLIALVLALLLLVGGCSVLRGNAPQPEQGTPAEAGKSVADQQPGQTERKETLELPMYDVTDAKLPTAKLGEPLQVGPVTLTVTLNGATYFDTFGLFRFHVTVTNKGDGSLNLDPRIAYWIASESILKAEGPLDPRKNWYIVGRRVDGSRLLIYPDPKLMQDLGYPDDLIIKGYWAVERLDPPAAPLPQEVPPGSSMQGDILLWHNADREILALGINPDEHHYLFWGNWLEPKAWGRIDLGSLPNLFDALVKQVGPNPPEPWNTVTFPGNRVKYRVR